MCEEVSGGSTGFRQDSKIFEGVAGSFVGVLRSSKMIEDVRGGFGESSRRFRRDSMIEEVVGRFVKVRPVRR